MNQPRITEVATWDNYKNNVFLVIREALLILRNQPNLPQIEDHPQKHNLNRELFRCFRKACNRKNLPYHLPTREGKNPPYKDDQEPSERESTIPDFYWQFIDSQADEESCERRFVLECKRLGTPSSSKWKFNQNYVRDGIRRFITSPHEYGKGDDACGMVGYVQSMELADIFKEVNAGANANPEPIALLRLSSEGWQNNNISELEHELTRPFPISPFRLHHFWIDIRRIA